MGQGSAAHAVPRSAGMALAAVLLAAAWTLLVVLLGATAAHADDRDGSSSAGTGLSGITAPVARLATSATAALHEAPVPVVVQEVATAPVAAASSAATSAAQTASPVVEPAPAAVTTTVTRAAAPVVSHVEQTVTETVTTAAAAAKPVASTVSATRAAVRGTVRDTVASVPAVVDRTTTVVDRTTTAVLPPVEVSSAPRGPSIDIPAAPSEPGAVAGTTRPATTPAVTTPSAAPGSPAERTASDAQVAPRGSSSPASSVTLPSARPALNGGSVIVTAPENPAPAGPEAPVAPAPVVSSPTGGAQQRGTGTGAGVPDATIAGGFDAPALLVLLTSDGSRTAVPSGPTLSFDVSPD